jgi:hypothetical protein
VSQTAANRAFRKPYCCLATSHSWPHSCAVAARVFGGARAELLKQTQSLMPAQTNPMQRLLLMRARPKVLLATNFEVGTRSAARGMVLAVLCIVGYQTGILCTKRVPT